MTNKKRLGVSVPQWMYEALKQESDYEGLTLNALILHILREWKSNKEENHEQHGNH